MQYCKKHIHTWRILGTSCKTRWFRVAWEYFQELGWGTEPQIWSYLKTEAGEDLCFSKGWLLNYWVLRLLRRRLCPLARPPSREMRVLSSLDIAAKPRLLFAIYVPSTLVSLPSITIGHYCLCEIFSFVVLFFSTLRNGILYRSLLLVHFVKQVQNLFRKPEKI